MLKGKNSAGEHQLQGDPVLKCTRVGNNWAMGYFGFPSDYEEIVMDSIRREIERSDRLQGIQITHSIGGGTGSGFGSLILDQLTEEYPTSTIFTYPVIPSTNPPGDGTVHAYNAVLTGTP